YYNHGCEDENGPMLRWVADRIPQDMRQSLSYAWVSYYACDCEGREPTVEEWRGVMGELRRLFPAASVGFGECGAARDAPIDEHQRVIEHYYTMRIPLDCYVGGCFFWYGRRYMVPKDQRLWHVLNDIMRR